MSILAIRRKPVVPFLSGVQNSLPSMKEDGSGYATGYNLPTPTYIFRIPYRNAARISATR